MKTNKIDQYIFDSIEDIKAFVNDDGINDDDECIDEITVMVCDKNHKIEASYDIITYLGMTDDISTRIILAGMCAKYLSDDYFAEISIKIDNGIIEFHFNGDAEDGLHYPFDTEGRFSEEIFDVERDIDYIKFDLNNRYVEFNKQIKYGKWENDTDIIKIIDNLFNSTVGHCYSDSDVLNILYSELKEDIEFEEDDNSDVDIDINIEANNVLTLNLKYNVNRESIDKILNKVLNKVKVSYMYETSTLNVEIDGKTVITASFKTFGLQLRSVITTSSIKRIDVVRKFLGEFIEDVIETGSPICALEQFIKLCKKYGVRFKTADI